MRWTDKEKTVVQDGNSCIPVSHQHYAEIVQPRLTKGEVIEDYTEQTKENPDAKLIELIDARIAASK